MIGNSFPLQIYLDIFYFYQYVGIGLTKLQAYYSRSTRQFIYKIFHMLLLVLLLVPLIGIFIISSRSFATADSHFKEVKFIGLATSIVNLLISLVVWVLFDFSSNQFQFVQECYELNQYSIYLGVDGLSIYFVLLTTIIMPLALLSN